MSDPDLYADVEAAIRSSVAFAGVTARGWHQTNCFACHETRVRGGFLFNDTGGPDSSIAYKCFNCSLSASWHAGSPIGPKFEKVLREAGIPANELLRLVLRSRHQNTPANISDNNNGDDLTLEEDDPEAYLARHAPASSAPNPLPADLPEFPPVPLPAGAQPLAVADPTKFEAHFKYMWDRGFVHDTDYADVWVCHDEWAGFDKRIFVPFRDQHNMIVGWSARIIDDDLVTETGQPQRKYMSKGGAFFGINHAFDPELRSAALFVCEGVLDAKLLNGFALGGVDARNGVVDVLNASPRRKVAVPDADKAGRKLATLAAKSGWDVAPIPDAWTAEHNIKDVNDAALVFGRHYVAWKLLATATKPDIVVDASGRNRAPAA